MTDDEFIEAFEAAAISREDWTHEAHLRMGWIYVTREADLTAATDKARSGIGKLNAANDVPTELYHETVTRAFMALIEVRVSGMCEGGIGARCAVGSAAGSGAPAATRRDPATTSSGAPAATGTTEWEVFRDAHLELLAQDKPILFKYYDKATLESDEARLGFVDPDRPFG